MRNLDPSTPDGLAWADPLRRVAIGTFCAIVVSFTVACGGGEPASEPMAEEPAPMDEPAPAAEASDGPRVFFVQPEDGAAVASPVTFQFGHENFTIEPRVEGEINAGAGHHHIGLNTECLPAGVIIPEAQPWIHFGDGSATIDMQLPAGGHTLTIQVGDGEHRTLDEPGLCQTITVTVTE